jgi:hypothetical protein
MFAPVNPPSLNWLGAIVDQSCRWLRMYASGASRWASSELKAWFRPSAVDLRV